MSATSLSGGGGQSQSKDEIANDGEKDGEA